MPALTGVSSHQSHDPAPDGETQQSDGKRPPSLSEVECGLPCPRTLVLEGDDSSLVEGLARRPVPPPPPNWYSRLFVGLPPTSTFSNTGTSNALLNKTGPGHPASIPSLPGVQACITSLA